MSWTLHYADGSAFSSEDGTPQESPSRGVVAYSMPDPQTGIAVYPGKDGSKGYFSWSERDGRWFHHDLPGLLDVLSEEPRLIRIGRYISDEDYQRITANAGKCSRREIEY